MLMSDCSRHMVEAIQEEISICWGESDIGVSDFLACWAQFNIGALRVYNFNLLTLKKRKKKDIKKKSIPK